MGYNEFQGSSQPWLHASPRIFSLGESTRYEKGNGEAGNFPSLDLWENRGQGSVAWGMLACITSKIIPDLPICCFFFLLHSRCPTWKLGSYFFWDRWQNTGHPCGAEMSVEAKLHVGKQLFTPPWDQPWLQSCFFPLPQGALHPHGHSGSPPYPLHHISHHPEPSVAPLCPPIQ